MTSIITDTSVKLALNPTQNLELLNKVNTNTQLFVNFNDLNSTLIPFITSNVLTSSYLPLKQDILTASTTLLGIGSSITDLTYANINGKPTNFQSDWNSTVINKPDILTATQINNSLNLKQDILTFTNPLSKTGTIISIDLSLYDNLTRKRIA